MIVVRDNNAMGYTAFFPMPPKHGGARLFIDLLHIFQYVRLYIIANVAITVLCILVDLYSPENFKYVAALAFFYVAIRIFRMKRVPIMVDAATVIYSLAPIPIWIDHFSYYFMLLCVVAVASIPSYYLFALPVEVALLGLWLAPIWAFIVYKRRYEM